MDKPFKTLDEQYKILIERGLNCPDKESVKQYLFLNNYYNVVNEYGHFLLATNNIYFNTANFSEIVSIKQFDSQIKSTLLKAVLDIENYFKSMIAYEFSQKFKDVPYAYLDRGSYGKRHFSDMSKLITDFNKVITKYSAKSEMNSIKHYSMHHDDIPLWVICDYMTFGQMVTMYYCLDSSLQNKIAKDFTFLARKCIHVDQDSKFRLNSKDIYQIMGSIKDLRNVLAHNNMLFNYQSRISLPYIEKLHAPLSILPDSQRKSIYDVFVIMHLFLNDNQYALYYNSILKNTKKLHKKLKSISSSKVTNTLGFPEDFYTKESIKTISSTIPKK